MDKDTTEFVKNQIPYQKYCIDSFRLSIDTACLTKIDIPENFILVSEDTGEEIEHFKKKSLQIAYKNSHIYISKFNRILRNQRFEKLIILFSAKSSDIAYFNGITKQTCIDVLNFLKDSKYIDFTDVSDVYKNLYCTDTDIKIDFKLKNTDKDKIHEYNKELKERFQFEKNEIKSYDNAQQLGLQCFHRDRSTIGKPFAKWYNKSLELPTKYNDFFQTLPDEIRNEVIRNFIYRFEFTIKNKQNFAKFGLSNRLEDVLEILQPKWSEVSKSILNTLFQVKIKRFKDKSKLDYKENILAFFMVKAMQVDGLSVSQCKTIFTSQQTTRKAKFKAGLTFDKLYNNVIEQNKSVEYTERYENIVKFDKLFGFDLK